MRRAVHIATIVSAYLGASCAAAFSILALSLAHGVAAQGLTALVPTPDDTALDFLIMLSVISGFIAVFALLPALAVVAHAEWKGIRACAYYSVLGVLVGIVGYAIAMVALRGFEAAHFPSSTPGELSTLVSLIGLPGFVAGLVYWAIAGRKAGLWRRSGAQQA